MELSQLFKDMGNEVSYEKLSTIMEEYDKDASGQVMIMIFDCIYCLGLHRSLRPRSDG
jgi:hypothetical protein